MATKLNKLLKREIDVDGKPYMVTLSPAGLKLTEKGKRLGASTPGRICWARTRVPPPRPARRSALRVSDPVGRR